MTNKNPRRLPAVENALEWAFRQGFTGAQRAVEDYAVAVHCGWKPEDLGQYGETVKFVDSPEGEAI